MTSEPMLLVTLQLASLVILEPLLLTEVTPILVLVIALRALLMSLSRPLSKAMSDWEVM